MYEGYQSALSTDRVLFVRGSYDWQCVHCCDSSSTFLRGKTHPEPCRSSADPAPKLRLVPTCTERRSRTPPQRRVPQASSFLRCCSSPSWTSSTFRPRSNQRWTCRAVFMLAVTSRKELATTILSSSCCKAIEKKNKNDNNNKIS